MFPPSGGYNLDIDAISGICGSVSIACWVVVYSPQIIENFRRSSADALSIEFVIIWTAGDVFNMLGAVLQGVLPTMIILAVYYTFADIVLLGQCFYYKGVKVREPQPVREPDEEDGEPTEEDPLIQTQYANGESMQPVERRPSNTPKQDLSRARSARSASSFRQRLNEDAAYLSPATPMHPAKDPNDTAEPLKPHQPRSVIQKILFNFTAITLVIAAGVAGYYLSPASRNTGGETSAEQDEILKFNLWGQIFGYICAALYLGSRIPQLLLNYRRKSTEGLNALFFLFACIGNLTYVMSIMAFGPICGGRHGYCRPGEAGRIYWTYVLVNLSWLIGSFGTFLLDLGVFVQFWIYRASEHSAEGAVPDDVPRREDGEGRGRAPNEQ